MPDSPTLADVRTDVRAALLDAGTAVVSVSVDQNADAKRLADLAKRLADLAAAYTDLGGDLELEQTAREAEARRAGAEVKRLRAPIAALLAALEDVSAEDFPPRLAGLVPLLNDLETAYRA
jgi:hypothetical protein